MTQTEILLKLLLTSKRQLRFVGEMAKAAEPIIGKMNRRINALSVAALPAFWWAISESSKMDFPTVSILRKDHKQCQN
ncbi:MAG: hypothetical protein ACLS43_08530 [Evtepia gabavorous]